MTKGNNKDFSFSFFRAPVTNKKPNGVMTVSEAYQYITSMAALEHTHALRTISNHDEARAYKGKHFDYATFSGTFSYGSDNGLLKHSSLLCLDFDHVGSPADIAELKQHIVKDSNLTTWLAFTSPSGDGMKVVVEIDLSKCDHRTWFNAFRNYFHKMYQREVDSQCANVSRACYLPHDALCYAHPVILKEKNVCKF